VGGQGEGQGQNGEKAAESARGIHLSSIKEGVVNAAEWDRFWMGLNAGQSGRTNVVRGGSTELGAR